MSTATEVLMRMQEAERRMEPARKMLDRMAADMMAKVLAAKVPLIRYGRRKRGSRRLFDGQIAAMRITFENGSLGVRPVTHAEMFRK